MLYHTLCFTSDTSPTTLSIFIMADCEEVPAVEEVPATEEEATEAPVEEAAAEAEEEEAS